MKRKARISPYVYERKRQLPATAQRVLHSELGIRCWLVDGTYYRSREGYAIGRPLVIEKAGSPAPQPVEA